jgi:hypothetical protein
MHLANGDLLRTTNACRAWIRQTPLIKGLPTMQWNTGKPFGRLVLRWAAFRYTAHGWPVVGGHPLQLATRDPFDVLGVPAPMGLRALGATRLRADVLGPDIADGRGPVAVGPTVARQVSTTRRAGQGRKRPTDRQIVDAVSGRFPGMGGGTHVVSQCIERHFRGRVTHRSECQVTLRRHPADGLTSRGFPAVRIPAAGPEPAGPVRTCGLTSRARGCARPGGRRC